MSRLALSVVLLMILLLGVFLVFEDDMSPPKGELNSSVASETASSPAVQRRRGVSPSVEPSRPVVPKSTPVKSPDAPSAPPPQTLDAPRIIGRVVDVQGKPMGDVRVLLMKSTMRTPSVRRRRVVSEGRCGEDGRFRIDDVPKGDLIVVFDRLDPAHIVGDDRALKVDAVQVYDLGDVVLGGDGHMKFTLRILLPDGRPAVGQAVRVNSYNPQKGPRSAVTDETGEVSFHVWAPEDGFSVGVTPPKGCERIFLRLLPDSQRPNFEGLLGEEGWLARSREYVQFYPGDEFFGVFRFKKKADKKKEGVLVFRVPRLTGPYSYCFSAKFLDNPPWGRGGSLNDGPPYEVKLPQGRLLVYVSKNFLGKEDFFTARRVAKKEILLGDRYEWVVEFDDVIQARGRLVRGGKPVVGARWRHDPGATILPFLNFGKTDEKGAFSIPLDPYSKTWIITFEVGKERIVHHTIHPKPLITDEDGHRVFDIGDIDIDDGESAR